MSAVQKSNTGAKVELKDLHVKTLYADRIKTAFVDSPLISCQSFLVENKEGKTVGVLTGVTGQVVLNLYGEPWSKAVDKTMSRVEIGPESMTMLVKEANPEAGYIRLYELADQSKYIQLNLNSPLRGIKSERGPNIVIMNEPRRRWSLLMAARAVWWDRSVGRRELQFPTFEDLHVYDKDGNRIK